jgi:hypothetical protein
MKTNQSVNQVQTSTYALLIRSEEKERSLFEAIAYGLTILSAVAAIWQFAAQPVKLPTALPHTASVAQVEDVSRS